MNRVFATIILMASLILLDSGQGHFSVTSWTNPLQAEKLTPQVVTNQSYTPLVLETKKESDIDLDEVNGISLHDDREAVLAKKGVPLEITQDPFIKDMEIYRYEDIEVAFLGKTVDSLSILIKSNGSFKVDGLTVEQTPESIHHFLGNPDYVAEDGVVYQRGESVLKVYLEPGLNEIVVIRYYSLANI
ncbi:MAG: hypothetical protein H7X86_12720 [Gorillibacterium sp.]|nr:hypothetical protein [Gorillibacterium sp.]